MNRTRPLRVFQRGQTLIGMMVGLVISLLTIAAMLAVYKMMIEVSGAATSDSLRDGQVASGLLAAQIEVQQAGFGVDQPVLAPGGAALATSDSTIRRLIAVADDGKRVTWSYRLSGRDFCAGLDIVPDTQGGARMYSLARRDDCSDAAAVLAEDDWDGTELVSYGGLWKARDGSDVAASVGLSLSSIDVESPVFVLDESAECLLPYGQQVRDAAVSTTISRPLRLVDANEVELFSTCLSNVVVAVTAPAAAGGGS